jgi:ABC-type antimicrobial peptide transport system permease subunit
MFKNYLTIAVRNFSRNKSFSAINILGLAIGISASLVIYLLVQYDFSFDKFHKDGDRIYRVVSKFDFSGEIFYNSGVTYPLGGAVQKEMTGVEEVAAFSLWDGDVKVSLPVNSSTTRAVFKKQKNIVFADEHYFNLLEYKWIAGSPKTSLKQPYQVVLSDAIAKLYFPKLTAESIIGKELIFNDTVRTSVTGIVKGFVENTDFTFNTFVSKATIENTSLKPDGYDKWGSTTSASQLFIKLSAGTTTAQIQKQLGGLYLKYNKPKPEDKNKVPYGLQPLGDLHFNANYGNYFDNHLAHKPTLYGLLAVAAFLLLLGCINFINLTTAQASQRAKEIGIRKTMGSSKAQLIFQFLSETFLLTLVATVLSVVITPLVLKVFADFIPEGLHFNLTQQPGLLLFLLLLTIFVSILSGFYPALILSGYKPVLVLKNQAYSNTGKTRNLWLRKTLTISQFVIAQVFIMATILVSKQISYTLSKDLGYKKDAIIYFETNFYDTVKSHKDVLMDKLKAIPGIAMISLSNNPITSNSTWSNTMKYKDGKKEIETNVQLKFGDTNYVKLYQLKLLAGRNISQSDTVKEFLINETYARILGFQQPEEAVGKYLEYSDSPKEITGVVADFHQQSLHDPIKPIAIGSWTGNNRNFNIALQPQDANGNVWKTTISKIEKAFKEVYPEDDFEYNFQDETIAKYYESEKNISRLLIWATGLSIFISCLGLLGLVMYITNQRTKEIGIRKVVGATISQIISLLSKDFLKLIIVAFIIAVPRGLVWYS